MQSVETQTNSGKLFLGIDTSCYTTSVAVITENGAYQLKKMLKVKSGECGLRQSDALFQHIKNIPELFDELRKNIDFKKYTEFFVTASTRPRSVDGSYMPVFLAGQAFAKTISDVLNAKYTEVSHQDGHIMAAIYSCKKYDLLSEPFLSVHLSGGTTEILLTKPTNSGFSCEIVGGTKDLPAGQFIDRIGVKMGMDFPCGQYLDYLAMDYCGDKPSVKHCVHDAFINFSGEETRFERLLESGEEHGLVAYCVMKCISDSIKCAVIDAMEKCKVSNAIMVGGVSSSGFLRQTFSEFPNVYFAQSALCCDNAVGVCELGRVVNDLKG